jgi:hypothetical protein
LEKLGEDEQCIRSNKKADEDRHEAAWSLAARPWDLEVSRGTGWKSAAAEPQRWPGLEELVPNEPTIPPQLPKVAEWRERDLRSTYRVLIGSRYHHWKRKS